MSSHQTVLQPQPPDGWSLLHYSSANNHIQFHCLQYKYLIDIRIRKYLLRYGMIDCGKVKAAASGVRMVSEAGWWRTRGWPQQLHQQIISQLVLILITFTDVYEDYQDIFIDDLDNQDFVLPCVAQMAHQALCIHNFW